MDEMMELTKNNKKMVFNICFAYNSDFEIENMIKKTLIENKENCNKNDFILEKSLFEKNLLIKEKPDIIVRTSNEIRLSNFLTF